MQITRVSVPGAVPALDTLAIRLRAAREFAGVNHTELAEMTGLSRNTIGRSEAGNHSPAAATVLIWAIACGVDSDWLMTGEVKK